MNAHPIFMIGASNVDISATSTAGLLEGDSNPGSVSIGFGGVGRNIAENLARLNRNPCLVTSYGQDEFSKMLIRQAKELGIDISLSLHSQDCSSSVYICVNRPDGEMYVAINDMKVCDLLTPAFFADKLDALSTAKAVVMDANLPGETLSFLAAHCSAPLFADAVSTKKAGRLRALLPRLTGLKSNRLEAELLTGLSIRTEKDAVTVAAALQNLGIQHVFLTMGSWGALVASGDKALWMPPLMNTMVNTTGCGDAFFAGALCALLDGQDILSMLRSGLGMAALCAASPGSVSPHISPDTLQDYLSTHPKEAHSYAIH